jgi:hypothetical protein
VQVRKQNVLLLMGALSFVAVLLSGCLKSVDNTPQKPKTYISIMHLAPRAPTHSVNVFFNTDKVTTTPIASGAYSGTYSPVDPGFFSISFKENTKDSLITTVPLDRYDSLNFYTIVLYNTDDNRIESFSIHDDYSGLQNNTTKTLYRFFHMSPDIGSVDVYFNNDKLESGRQHADNAFGSAYNQFQLINGNSYSIAVKKAGTDSVIAETSKTMDIGQAYTIFLKGVINGTGNNTLGVSVLQAATQ